jgi:hypothetical protein
VTPGQLARDRRVEAAVRARLDREESAHLRSLARYEVAVLDGLTALTGHVRSRQTANQMSALAARVAGVAAVQDRLVADDELVGRVASAIGRSVRHRASRLVVRAALGHVRIGGAYPSHEAHADALRIGAGVPGVLTAGPARSSDLIG